MPETIDLTPTTQGYAQICRVFISQIADDIRKSRKTDDMHILVSLIDTMSHIRSVDEKLYTQITQDMVK